MGRDLRDRMIVNTGASAGTRLGLALTTAMPRLGAWSMRQIVINRYRDGGDGQRNRDEPKDSD